MRLANFEPIFVMVKYSFSFEDSKFIQSVGLFDNYLRSEYGFCSESKIFQYFGLTILLIEQLLLIYAPYFFKLVSVIILLFLPSTRIFNPDEVMINSELQSKYNDNIFTKEEPIIFNNYRNFVDDRKAKLGSLSDIKRLKMFGFNKYRYLSKSFIKLLDLEENETSKSISSQKEL